MPLPLFPTRLCPPSLSQLCPESPKWKEARQEWLGAAWGQQSGQGPPAGPAERREKVGGAELPPAWLWVLRG